MTAHRFYVGTRDKHGKPVKRGVGAKIAARLVEAFGGVTQYRTVGAWTDATGAVKTERAVVYEALSTDIGAVEGRILAGWIRETARQASVLYTRNEVEGRFV